MTVFQHEISSQLWRRPQINYHWLQTCQHNPHRKLLSNSARNLHQTSSHPCFTNMQTWAPRIYSTMKIIASMVSAFGSFVILSSVRFTADAKKKPPNMSRNTKISAVNNAAAMSFATATAASETGLLARKTMREATTTTMTTQLPPLR